MRLAIFSSPRSAGLLWCLLCSAWNVQADTPAPPPSTASWQAPNPYRQAGAADVQLLARGAQAYGQHCAQCHGDAAVQPSAEGPDLRRLDSFCRRLHDPQLKTRCQFDVDSYFSLSVQEGKVRAGVVHMPAWKTQISADTAWAIQRFVETRPRPEVKRSTSVDSQR